MPIRNDHTEEAKIGMREALERALEKAGLLVESTAKLELENSPRRVDTGLLRNSITYAVSGQPPAISNYASDDGTKTGSYSGTVPDEDVKTAYIGSNVSYSVYVHEGTEKMAPNRFLRNAVERNRDAIKTIIENELREG